MSAIQLQTSQQNTSKVANLAYLAVLACFFAVAFLFPDLAHAGGLTKAESGLTKFQTDILPIVRIACILGVIGCGLGYVFQWADNKRIFQIFIGVLVIASASEIVNLIW
ncbi:TrbC/VirB2 family protein [Acinetobacter pittii]|uniref:TrbC/VirB2 family protein n=1 Tax=Acinetobacter pittii TaxID=48296 RepID=UPI0032610E52